MTLTPERLALLDAKAKPNDHRTVYLQASELHELLDLLAEVAAEVERLRDTEKVQGAMIRELERLNTELNDELGTAVQVLKLERDTLRGQVAKVRELVEGGSFYMAREIFEVVAEPRA